MLFTSYTSAIEKGNKMKVLGELMLNAPVGQEFKSKEIQSVAPSQRLHLILLGVENIAKSTKFYESLGWKKSPTGNEGFIKFDLGGYALCLISRSDFAKDAMSATEKGSGFYERCNLIFHAIYNHRATAFLAG